MALAHVDILDSLELVERGGVLNQVKRLARVTGLDGDVDWRVLRTALDHPDVPKYGDYLPPDLFELKHLIVSERQPKIYDKDKGCVEIVLTYDHVLNGPYQDLTGGVHRRAIYGRMRSSVIEDETDKEPVDANGSPAGTVRPAGHPTDHAHYIRGYRAAIVAYTMPANHATNRGQADVQLGQFKVVFPQATYQITGWLDVNDPSVVENYYLAKINNHAWLGKPAETWLCTEVQYQLMGARSPDVINFARYQFSFEFQYKSDGWQPGIVYIDKDTNRPPQDVIDSIPVAVTGYYGNIGAARRIDYYSKIDFRGPSSTIGKGYFGVAEDITEV